MASIRKRVTSDGKTKWHVQVRLLGFEPQTKTFDRKTDAEAWGAETERLMRTNSFQTARESQRRTVRDLFEAFKRDYMRPTRERDYTQILAWWEQKIGHLYLANLKASVIQRVLDDLAREPIPAKKAATDGQTASAADASQEARFRTAATLTRYLAVLSAALSAAVKNLEWLDRSPLAGVKRPTPEVEEIPRALTAAEEHALLQAVNQSDSPYLKPVVLVALRTGMRHGEILGLRWGDIEFSDGFALIRVRKAKNKRQRFVPLVRDALASVLELKASLAEVDDGALLFPSPTDATKPVATRTAWETALRRAGISDFRFHDLRHSAASALIALQASLPEVAEILGHTDHRSTQIYTHFEKTHAVRLAQMAADSRWEKMAATANPESGSN